MLKNILILFMLMGFINGCNTIQGAGKDMERGGEKVQGAAERAK